MIKIALIVEAETRLTWYGAELGEITLKSLRKQYGEIGDVELLEGYDEFAEGLMIKDPDQLASSGLIIKYFFPEEETPEEAGSDRLVDVDRMDLILLKPPRKKCAPGHVYLCGGEAARGSRETLFFDAGFFPPFRPEQISVYILDLFDFGYEGYMLSQIRFAGREPVYSESEITPANRLQTRLLED